MIVDEDNNYNYYYDNDDAQNSDAYVLLGYSAETNKIICITHSLGFWFFTHPMRLFLNIQSTHLSPVQQSVT